MNESRLSRITVVLDEPQDPVNIAATVRAMANMGVSTLRLVRPTAYEPHRLEGIAHGTRELPPPRKDAPPATGAELEQFYADAQQSLDSIEFFKTRQMEHIMRTVRSLTARAAPDARELSLIRAMVIEVRNYLNRRRP